MEKHMFIATIKYLLTLHSRNLALFSDIHSSALVYCLLGSLKRNYFIGEYHGQRFVVFKSNRAAKILWENSYAFNRKCTYLNEGDEPREVADGPSSWRGWIRNGKFVRGGV